MSNYYKKQQKKGKKKTKERSETVKPTTSSSKRPILTSSAVSGNTLELDSFTQIQTVSIGAFGTLSVVRNEQTSKLYALKSMSKAEVIRLEEIESIETERSVLKQLDQPFVIKL